MVELSQRVNGLFWVKKRRERNEFPACSHNLCTGAITPWVVLLLLLISIVLLYSTLLPLLLHLYCATKSIQYPSYQSITTLVKQGITSVNKKTKHTSNIINGSRHHETSDYLMLVNIIHQRLFPSFFRGSVGCVCCRRCLQGFSSCSCTLFHYLLLPRSPTPFYGSSIGTQSQVRTVNWGGSGLPHA